MQSFLDFFKYISTQYNNLILIVILVVGLFLFYKILNNKNALINDKFKIKNSELTNSNLIFRTYCLYLGILLPYIEILIHLFKLRVDNLFIENLSLSFILILIYFITIKENLIFRNLKIICAVIFVVFNLRSFRNLIIYPQYTFPSLEILFTIFLSFLIFESTRFLYAYIALMLVTLISLFYFDFISNTLTLNLLIYSLLLILANYVKFKINANTNQRMLFTDNIVNNGSSLTLAVNLDGEVIYCSDSIINILGYNANDVLGMNFWEFTQDKDFKAKDYEISKQLYVRKLLCKDGSFKYIQWKDSQYSEFVIFGIGQDVTEQIELQNKYKNLIENANDLIFETDKLGYVTYVNNFTLKTLGYSENEIIGKLFNDYIKEEFKTKIFELYANLHNEKSQSLTSEFSVFTKNGSEIWLSQKVNVKRDELGKIIGYFAFSRDITYQKNIEIEKQNREEKIIKYDKSLNEITAISYSKNKNFEEILKSILQNSCNAVEVSKTGYWKFYDDKIVCQVIFSKNTNKFETGEILFEKDYPNYFESISERKQFVINNSNDAIDFKPNSYTNLKNIKSWIDSPVFYDRKISGIFSLECINNYRIWDDLDTNFARSVSDIIALTLETQNRIEAEKNLFYKSKMLAAISQITNNFLSEFNIDSTFNETLKIIGKVANADRAYYFTNNDVKKTITIKNEWVNQKIKPEIDNTDLQNIPHKTFIDFLDLLYENKEYSSVVSKLELSDFKTHLQNQDILSILILPVFVKNQFHSFIGFDDCTTERIWSEDEINILKTLANNISVSIEKNINELLIQESERKLVYKSEVLSEINRVSDQFLRYQNIDEIFKGILPSIGTVVNVTHLSYFKYEADKNNFYQKFRFVKNEPNLEITNPELASLPEKIVSTILTNLQNQKYYLVKLSNFNEPLINNFLINFNVKSILILPIYKKDELDGVLAFNDGGFEREWAEDEIGILGSLANNISAAIERNYNKSIIQESEEKFRLLADNIPGTVYLSKYDKENTKIYINDKIEKLTGYHKSDFLENRISYASLIHNDDRKKVLDDEAKAIKSKTQIHSIYRLIRKDQSIIWIEEFGDAIYKNDKIEFIEGIFIDITYKKEAEEKLLYKTDLLAAISLTTNNFLTSSKFEDFFNQSLKIIGEVTDVDKIYYFENNHSSKTVNLKFEWNSINSNSDIENPIYQNFGHDNIFGSIKVMYQNKILNQLTQDLKNSDYKDFLVANNILSSLLIPIFIDNQLYSFIGFDDKTKHRIWNEDEINILQTFANNIATAIERNISQNVLQESEEKFRLLANNIPGTVYLSRNDEFATKIFLNDEIETLTGYKKEDFLEKNLSYLSLIHKDDKSRIIYEQKIALLNKQQFQSVYRIIHKNGSIKWVEEFGDAIRKKNEIEYIGGIYIDITQKKINEKAIIEKEFAQAASKAKSEFLANMSHEIRTPLNGIIGFTNLLMNTELEEVQQHYMETVNNSALSLMEVVNDVLDFSKIEAGKLEIEIIKQDISLMSNQIIDLIKYQASEKDIDLFLKIDKNISKFIWTDIVRIKQILINLLSNALKFTTIGKVELLIKLIEKVDENKSIIRFSVKDTGIGIKKANQEKIFNAFSQEDTSTTRKFGGTGLGLTISNQLLKLLGSKLELKSTYNKGSEFFFDIELRTSKKLINLENVNEDLKIITESLENKSIQFGQENYKILIVEDNKINMLLAKTLVKQIVPNISIFELSNGKEALDKIDLINPDLILMDIQMPILNGYEATLGIRKMEHFKHLPIIALTAGIVLGEKERCLEAGMNDYVSKPIIKEELQNVILKWLIK